MFIKSPQRCSVLVVLIAPLMLAGCGGGGTPEYRVTGSVTFDGQPIEQGEIFFLPTDAGGAPQVGQIVNGKFECQVTEGQKRVEITATRESPKPAPDGLPNYESYIPAAYNTQSTLTAEVNPKTENTFTFALQSSSAGL